MNNLLALNSAEITQKSTDIALQKSNKKLTKIIINGILAGIFIAIGAMFSINSISGLGSLPYGLVKIIAGLTFSIGLILVMVAGADLFTGDALMVTAVLDKKVKIQTWMKHLGIIWIANLIGSLILVFLLALSGRDGFNNGNIAETILTISTKKMHYERIQAFGLGILCNILVCLGVWLTRAGKTVTDKIIGIIFPITAFVACGFEHCVANMFYLPYAWTLGLEVTIGEMLIYNFLPVTLGNLFGGVVFVGLAYWLGNNRE